MKYILPSMVTIILTGLLLTACNDEKTKLTSGSSNVSNSSINIVFTTDAWLGKWNGPEGTFLEINGGEGKYILIIQDLDGPKTYQGISNDDNIEFERNDKKEIIHATNGTETGMKWLADKSDCLTVRTGEGYCRD